MWELWKRVFYFSWLPLRRAQHGPCVLQLQTHLGRTRTYSCTSCLSRTTRWRCCHLSVQLSLSNLWDHDGRRCSSANMIRAGIMSINAVHVQINVALRHKVMFVRWIIIHWMYFINKNIYQLKHLKLHPQAAALMPSFLISYWSIHAF